MNKLFRIAMPYCLDLQPDGSYVILNRDYKPLGFAMGEFANYQNYPIRHALEGLGPAIATKISCHGSSDLSRIYLYHDGSNPTNGMACNWNDYIRRLEYLSRLMVCDAPVTQIGNTTYESPLEVANDLPITKKGNTLMNAKPQLPTLYALCAQTQEEIIALSGLSEATLSDAYLELGAYVAAWHSDYSGPAHNDPFVVFTLMLDGWKSPWPCLEGSRLNGLTCAQFYLAWAYGKNKTALQALTSRPTKFNGTLYGYDKDDAACFAVYAAKSLTHAKQLIALGQDRLAIKAPRRKVA